MESSSSKAANLKPKIQLAKAGCLLKQKVERNPAFHEDRKGKGPSLVSKSMSFNGVISEESNAYCSEVLLPDAYELHNRAMCLLASDSGVTAENSKKETISSGDTLFSGSSFHNLDVVECTRKSDHRLQASKHNIHNDSDCLNKMKNDSPQVEHATKATTTMMMKVHASNERSHLRDLAQLEAGTLSKGLVIPKSHYAWLYNPFLCLHFNYSLCFALRVYYFRISHVFVMIHTEANFRFTIVRGLQGLWMVFKLIYQFVLH